MKVNGGEVVFLIATYLSASLSWPVEFTLDAAGAPAIKTFENSVAVASMMGSVGLSLCPFILLSFYSVIGGWIPIYLGVALGELSNPLS